MSKIQNKESYIYWVNDEGLPVYFTNKEGRIVNFTAEDEIKSTMWDNKFIRKFFEVADPKWLKLALESESKIADDPSWNDVIDINNRHLNYYKSLSHQTRKQENCRSHMLKLNRAIRSLIQGRGRPIKVKNVEESKLLNLQLDNFINKGMKYIKPLSKYTPPKKTRRYKALEEFIYFQCKEFNHEMDTLTLKRLNEHFRNRRTLLRAIFTFLIGVVDNNTNIKPESILRSLTRILNP